MRFVIYGIGAIGGTLAACLARSGQNVTGIARGTQLEAIRQNGLTLRVPGEVFTRTFACVAHPSEIEFQAGDVIVLCMKTQDTSQALEALRAAGVRRQPIVCAQNGVANERFALRLFENVIGAVVMMPATYLKPGEVAAIGTPRHGLFDIGRYPSGMSGDVTAICMALDKANFAAFPHENVMRAKYGKLLLNAVNGVDACLGIAARDGRFADMVRAEARAVYAAAGIEFEDVGATDPRRAELMHDGDVGMRPVGSSAAQSLTRSAGSIETDYLNGEIVLLGRLHGIAAPANALFAELAAGMALKGTMPGAYTEAEIDNMLSTRAAE
jgi:2-dehydropantoate 2-reductase